jgi:hypothetical protein
MFMENLSIDMRALPWREKISHHEGHPKRILSCETQKSLTTELAIFQKAVSPVDSERKRLYPFLDNLPASWLIQERKGYSHEKDSTKKAQVRQ